MSQKQQLGASSFLSRSMGRWLSDCSMSQPVPAPPSRRRTLGLELINRLLVSLGGKPDAQSPEYIEAQGVEILLAGWPSPRIIPWSANILLLAGWILLLCNKNAASLGF